ncbi:hypothetical protein GP486_004375 [Trichoglossum hirsutum]|uniref:GPI inositol-deacylase n=1 Tax=Trichoglossum hirsutum TaxID=265104 RepID=A0A9P8LBA3_9PEZI|nr:hypothetical protein GP486_004375 [Trichoglossum hirsutum]
MSRRQSTQVFGIDENWSRMQNIVIDLEVEACTPSPTVDPSVHVILIGHSMGGIVAAETAIAIAAEQPLTQSSETAGLLFPYISGIIAYDTPYLGISPGVIAHGAEGHYNTASAALTQLSGFAGGLWGGSTAAKKDSNTSVKDIKALPAPSDAGAPVEAVKKDGDAAAAPTWQRWGKIAMFAGAAGAVAAGGAAAYMKREQITEGWNWVGSHLEFVGCLVKAEDLKKRMAGIIELVDEYEMGFVEFYTVLGNGFEKENLAEERTFCVLPHSEWKQYFKPAKNDKARDETLAHMSTFQSLGLQIIGTKALNPDQCHHRKVLSIRPDNSARRPWTRRGTSKSRWFPQHITCFLV